MQLFLWYMMHILKCTAHFFIKFWIDGFVATCIYYFAKYIRVHLIVNIDDANYTCCRNLPKICPNPKVQNSGSKLQPNSKIRPKSEIRVGVRKSERNLFYMVRNRRLRIFFLLIMSFFYVIFLIFFYLGNYWYPFCCFFYSAGFLDFLENIVTASWTFRRLMCRLLGLFGD